MELTKEMFKLCMKSAFYKGMLCESDTDFDQEFEKWFYGYKKEMNLDEK